ncbi:hypothetical protein [Desulfovibrio oxyclinae]|uniref:hypothetical protein n=1 Tax=Desulfovibrio oxyclinae TaxID=63560 RepID=UPI000362B03F|nr:hypothetical protein [Desulfovibrio oxyclinae]
MRQQQEIIIHAQDGKYLHADVSEKSVGVFSVWDGESHSEQVLPGAHIDISFLMDLPTLQSQEERERVGKEFKAMLTEWEEIRDKVVDWSERMHRKIHHYVGHTKEEILEMDGVVENYSERDIEYFYNSLRGRGREAHK